MRNNMNRLLTLLVTTTLIGCAAQPEVRYFDMKGDTEGMYKFTLPKSYIHLGSVKSEERGSYIDAKSVPIDSYAEADQYSLMMQPVSSIFQETNVTQLATLPNTRVPSAIGSEVTDHREEIIATAAKVASLVVLFGLEVQKPFKPDLLEVKEATNQPLPMNPEWKYDLSLGAVPKDAISFDDFKKLSNEGELAVFPFSACRDANLTLTPPPNKKCDDKNIECKGLQTLETEIFKEAPQKPSSSGEDKIAFSLKVADPSFVTLIKIPTKGQVTMHPACGIDVKSEKSSGSSVDWGLLGKLIQHAKDTKETIDKNKDKNKK